MITPHTANYDFVRTTNPDTVGLSRRFALVSKSASVEFSFSES